MPLKKTRRLKTNKNFLKKLNKRKTKKVGGMPTTFLVNVINEPWGAGWDITNKNYRSKAGDGKLYYYPKTFFSKKCINQLRLKHTYPIDPSLLMKCDRNDADYKLIKNENKSLYKLINVNKWSKNMTAPPYTEKNGIRYVTPNKSKPLTKRLTLRKSPSSSSSSSSSSSPEVFYQALSSFKETEI